MKSILLVKKLLGLVEMMSGLVNASFSLHPVWAHGKYNSGLVNSVQVIEFAICKKSVPFTEKNMAAKR